MLSLEEKFIHTIKKHHLLEEGDSVLLGVSGGPDSVALLFLFYKLKDKLDLRLIVAHFNHKIRGKEADEDEKFVKALAQKKGMKFVRDEVVNFKKELSEDEARELRYRFFFKTAQREGVDRIALGHNRDDQAETVFLHFLRGAGVAGLRGMQYKQNKIIRPLLDCTKKEILNFLKRKKVPFRIDSTNLMTNYKRNFIRLKLLPLIRKEINPGIDKTLCHQAKIMQRLERLLAKETQRTWQRLEIKRSEEEFILNLKELLTLDEFLQLEILKKAILEIKKDLKDIYSYHLEEILQLLHSQKKAKKELQGITFLKQGHSLHLTLLQSPSSLT